MKYTIELFDIDHFYLLEKEWKRLEIGAEMTVFQSFEWNRMLVNLCLLPDNKYYETRFVVIKKDGNSVLIAPFWVIKRNFRFVNKRGIYFVGRQGWSDYLNCIYDDFDDEAFLFLLNEVSNIYNIFTFYFEELPESASVSGFIMNKFGGEIVKEDVCVSLELPLSVEEYLSILSKNAKQNLRTANNRIKKDNCDISFCFEDQLVDRNKCAFIREKKLQKQYRKISVIRKQWYRFKNKLRFHFNTCFPLFDYYESKVMTAYINSELCAFFNYVIDDNHNSIVILTAGTNLDYARYSPGILLMYNFIQKMIGDNNQCFLDFTRGEEQYKFSLGGTSHKNITIGFTMS